jgi:hypothetical protein
MIRTNKSGFSRAVVSRQHTRSGVNRQSVGKTGSAYELSFIL